MMIEEPVLGTYFDERAMRVCAPRDRVLLLLLSFGGRTGEITEFEPPGLLAFALSDTAGPLRSKREIRFELTDDGDHTVVRLTRVSALGMPRARVPRY
jgi:hypothetical protein